MTWLADAVCSGDVPRHAGLGPKRCELPWAVVDVDVGAGARRRRCRRLPHLGADLPPLP